MILNLPFCWNALVTYQDFEDFKSRFNFAAPAVSLEIQEDLKYFYFRVQGLEISLFKFCQ